MKLIALSFSSIFLVHINYYFVLGVFFFIYLFLYSCSIHYKPQQQIIMFQQVQVNYLICFFCIEHFSRQYPSLNSTLNVELKVNLHEKIYPYVFNLHLYAFLQVYQFHIMIYLSPPSCYAASRCAKTFWLASSRSVHVKSFGPSDNSTRKKSRQMCRIIRDSWFTNMRPQKSFDRSEKHSNRELDLGADTSNQTGSDSNIYSLQISISMFDSSESKPDMFWWDLRPIEIQLYVGFDEPINIGYLSSVRFR